MPDERCAGPIARLPGGRVCSQRRSASPGNQHSLRKTSARLLGGRALTMATIEILTEDSAAPAHRTLGLLAAAVIEIQQSWVRAARATTARRGCAVACSHSRYKQIIKLSSLLSPRPAGRVVGVRLARSRLARGSSRTGRGWSDLLLAHATGWYRWDRGGWWPRNGLFSDGGFRFACVGVWRSYVWCWAAGVPRTPRNG